MGHTEGEVCRIVVSLRGGGRVWRRVKRPSPLLSEGRYDNLWCGWSEEPEKLMGLVGRTLGRDGA